MDAISRIETCLNLAFARAQAPSGPPLLAAAMRHAVFPGGARVRPRLVLTMRRPGAATLPCMPLSVNHWRCWPATR
jgi:geranylgeranyl pyrophosphate synthase